MVHAKNVSEVNYDGVVEVVEEIRATNPSYFSVGEVADALENLVTDGEVTDDSLVVTLWKGMIVGFDGSVGSYRGYYEDLMLELYNETSMSGLYGAATVRELINSLLNVIGTSVEGYKGGDFWISSGTTAWIDSYGNASGVNILGIAAVDGTAVIVGSEPEEF